LTNRNEDVEAMEEINLTGGHSGALEGTCGEGG